ncbi:hypothetical protein B296_00018334 [Ensete ventricosum]|uniref:Uncharacterized protein n=1 Tax=Ensete ventricosum TaxID=4639 RepID=A0A426ZFI1_ENSVE|nr:hypothetical protein B296_00018334 [Ensete ventricosum]
MTNPLRERHLEDNKRICGDRTMHRLLRRSSPRGWWSPKLPEGRMQSGKLLQQDGYPGGIRPGYHQFNANREAEQLGWNLVKYPSRMKGVDVEDGNMERKHRAFLRQSVVIRVVIKKVVHNRDCAGRGIKAQDLDNGASILANTSESHGGDLIIQRYDQSDWRVGLFQCLYSFKGARQVRGQARLPKSKASVIKEVDSEERHNAIEADLLIAKKGTQRGETSVESSIPCSHGGRALVVKGAEEVENAEANSKYQDRAEGQRPKNFIRLVSTGFSSKIAESEGLQVDAGVLDQGTKYTVCDTVPFLLRGVGGKGDGEDASNFAFSTPKRMGEVEYPSSLTYPAEELCISSVTLRRKLIEDNSCQILTIGDQYY